MSECEYFEPSDDDDDVKKDDCALIDSVSEISFEERKEVSVNTSKLKEDFDDPAMIQIDTDWISKKCHVFILSTAGKPIYCSTGSEEKLERITLFSLLHAFVSVTSDGEDTIRSITVKKDAKFVFLVKSPLILVGLSRDSTRSENQILNLLMDVYNQIVSIVTLSHMNNVFEKRSNYDFRKLLAGSERLLDFLLQNETQKKISNNTFVPLLHSVRILPLESSVRQGITSIIQSNCSKIKNLIFAVLIANNKLVTISNKQNYFIHTDDLRIICNLIESTKSFKGSESWTPLCLPKFNSNGFLHAHVSYLSDDCDAALLLISADSESFFTLSAAKQNIVEKMGKSNYLEAINEGIKNRGICLKTVGVADIRHFIYKNKRNTQLLCSEITTPYNTLDEFERLESLYYDLHNRIHRSSRPLKLIYEMNNNEIQLAWVTSNYEFYAVFGPLVDKKSTVIAQVNKLLKYIKTQEDKLFITANNNF